MSNKQDILIRREWSMPNSRTFEIKPIRDLIMKYVDFVNDGVIVDPFANNNKIANITNDLDPQYDTDFHMDAADFLKTLQDRSADLVLYDPPYSQRQVAECYKSLGKTVNMQTTQISYWTNQKKEIARILKPNGYCITFGWNSNGVGMKYGMEIVEILLVAHGSHHNDTICTVERKFGFPENVQLF
jgi:hypothetical protein